MKARLLALKEELGVPGLAALAVLALATAFSVAVLRPLEERRAQLDRQLEPPPARPTPDGFKRVRAATQASQLERFYRYFDRPERADEWLAKMYGIATASGLTLRSGDYRLIDTKKPVDRYQITVPVSGSYGQIRAFLETSLAEIPVLSLDQVSFRRKSSTDPRIDAELVMTLHLKRG